MRYKCDANDGDDGGIFEVKKTKKSVILTGIKKPYFTNGDVDDQVWDKKNKRCIIPKDNHSKNCIKLWDDGTFTVYFLRSGTPYYFEEVEK